MPGMWPRTQNSFSVMSLYPAQNLAVEIVETDRRQLLHLEALRIVTANLVQIGDDMAEINFGEIDDQVFSGHVAKTLRASCRTGRWTGTVDCGRHILALRVQPSNFREGGSRSMQPTSIFCGSASA